MQQFVFYSSTIFIVLVSRGFLWVEWQFNSPWLGKAWTVGELCQSGWRTRSEMVGELGMDWQQGKNGWETRLERSEN